MHYLILLSLFISVFASVLAKFASRWQQIYEDTKIKIIFSCSSKLLLKDTLNNSSVLYKSSGTLSINIEIDSERNIRNMHFFWDVNLSLLT